jgi:alpha-galactosidase
MRDAGYVYVNIDDTWEGVRDAQGNLQSNSKFPDMKALADYVHSKGLKIGIYSSPGPRTCGEYPATYGHEEQDAKTFAAWGFDYLKYDWCSAGNIYKDDKLQPVYQKMGDALAGDGTADRLQPVRVRTGRRAEVGRAGGRESVAHDGRHQR